MASKTAACVIARAPLPRGEGPDLVSATPSRDDVVAAMTRMLSLDKPGSTAEALKRLRVAYPDSPLALRLAALAAAMKRQAVDPNGIYLRYY